MLNGALIPDVQAARMCGDRRPDIFAGPALADGPGLVEQRDGAIGRNRPDEMDSTSRDRQLFGQLGDLTVGQAAVRAFGPVSGQGRAIAQLGRRVAGVVPLDEGRAGAPTSRDRQEVPALEESPSPELVELFDIAVAFWFGDRHAEGGSVRCRRRAPGAQIGQRHVGPCNHR